MSIRKSRTRPAKFDTRRSAHYNTDVLTKPTILVDRAWGPVGPLVWYINSVTRAIQAIPKKRRPGLHPHQAACKNFKIADKAYSNLPESHKQIWRDAVKKAPRSGYDQWMKESVPWLNRGFPGPVLPSESGAFTPDLSRPGHCPLPDLRTKPDRIYTQGGRIRVWLHSLGPDLGTAAIIETNFTDHTGQPFTLPVKLEAYTPDSLDPYTTTFWPAFGNHERKLLVLSGYDIPLWSDFMIRTSVIFACVEAIEEHRTRELIPEPELPPFTLQPADLHWPHFPDEDGDVALGVLPAEANIPIGIPPGPEPLITCRALITAWSHYASRPIGNIRRHVFKGNFIWLVTPSHHRRRTKLCYRLSMWNIKDYKSRWYQNPIDPLYYRLGRRASYHFKWKSYPIGQPGDWEIEIRAPVKAELILRLGFRYGNYLETWLPYWRHPHQIKLPVQQNI